VPTADVSALIASPIRRNDFPYIWQLPSFIAMMP